MGDTNTCTSLGPDLKQSYASTVVDPAGGFKKIKALFAKKKKKPDDKLVA